MTINLNIKCPYCGKAFSLKMQMDNVVYHGQLPFSIVCPDCLSELTGNYGKKGLLPLNLIGGDDEYGTVVGYSSTLPVPEHLYLNDDWPTVGLSSVFMNLSIVYGDLSLENYSPFVNMVVENLLPVKKALSVLRNILQSSNVRAFNVAINKEYGKAHGYRIPTTEGECKVFFDNRLNDVYKLLVTDRYADVFFIPHIAILLENIKRGSANEFGDIYKSLSAIVNFTDWQRKEAYPFIARMIGEFDKFLPILLLSQIGEYDVAHPTLRITTINKDDVNSFYNQGVETLDHILPLYVGLTNWMMNNDVDCFQNAAAKGISGIEHFSKLPLGGKMDKTLDYPEVAEYLGPAVKTEIRNGIAHNGVQYAPRDQILSYYHKVNDPAIHYDEQLIDVALRCYLLLLHVMEMSHLLNVLKNKKK